MIFAVLWLSPNFNENGPTTQNNKKKYIDLYLRLVKHKYKKNK